MDPGPAHRRDPDAREAGVQISSDDDGQLLHVTVHGRWDWSLALTVRRILDKCLAEHPTAVIVNLRATDDPPGVQRAPAGDGTPRPAGTARLPGADPTADRRGRPRLGPCHSWCIPPS
jgi:hypothetical protein